MDLRKILSYLPEVRSPTEKKLSFNIKLKWTLIVLVFFFVMSNIPLYGLAGNTLARFEYLSVIIGASFGSIISLGIGPIVMASIILQLLVGAKIIDIDVSTAEGKKFFQGLQKLLVIFFILFEAIIYVVMQGLAPDPALGTFYGPFILILQLVLGGVAIVFMDEITYKWGFGSGVSLFIAAGVGWRLFSAAFAFLGTQGLAGGFQPTGKVWAFIFSIINADSQGAMLALAALLSTTILFLIVVWAQSLKIEIPLSHDRIRGYTIKWPLQFFYASNMPVILVAALFANLQLFGGLLQNALGHPTFLGNMVDGRAVSGVLYWISETDIVSAIITGSWAYKLLLQAFGHILFFMILSAVFSVFWVKTSSMDASSQAQKILNSGLQIPGFRKDERILESILKRYVMPLTVMGGLAIGLLASVADVLGTLTGGTSLLLGIMIVFQLYQNIAQQHAMDMSPALKKMMGA
jgi:preprotein translocase subunit SecY